MELLYLIISCGVWSITEFRLTRSYQVIPSWGVGVVFKNLNMYFFSQPVSLQGGLRQKVGNLFMCVYVCGSTVISSSSSRPSSLEEGSSQTCIGAVSRDLSLYDIMSGIRWLCLHSNTVCCTILSVERYSLGNTSLHRDKMSPPLQEYSSVLYYTILYYTKRFARSQQYQAR